MYTGDYFDISMKDFGMTERSTYLLTITGDYPIACSGTYIVYNSVKGLGDIKVYAIEATGHSLSLNQDTEVFRFTYNYQSGQKVQISAIRIG